MAGLIRPEYAPRQRLRFARISTREKPSVLNLVASPSRFLPEAPPSPFDQVPNAINEWLITDLEIYGFTRAWKREADPKAALKDKAYVILATPGQMLMVPPEELVAYYQLKKLIEGAPKDWLAVGRERYPGGSVLTLYKSRAYWERWER